MTSHNVTTYQYGDQVLYTGTSACLTSLSNVAHQYNFDADPEQTSFFAAQDPWVIFMFKKKSLQQISHKKI